MKKVKNNRLPKIFYKSQGAIGSMNNKAKNFGNEIMNENNAHLTIDVYQTEDDIVIKSTIAGVESKDIDIDIASDMVNIRGNRAKDTRVNETDYYYQECYWGPFSRSVILPVEVEADNAKASMKNGILTIVLPKVGRAKVKKIKIDE